MTHQEQPLEAIPSPTDELRTRWKQLPQAERRQLLTEWLMGFLEIDEGEELLHELPQFDQPTYQTNSISKADLINSRPDLVANILALSNDEIGGIAEEIGESIMEAYWLAMEYVLNKTFKMADTNNGEMGDPDEHQ